MTKAVVDTDVVSYVFKNHPFGSRYDAELAGRVALISFMTVAEMERWVIQRRWGTQRIELLRTFLQRFTVVPSSPDLCRKWAEVMVAAQAAGRRIETSDAWIAARFDITGYQGTGIGGEFRPNDTHSLSAQVQKSQGKHMLKGGMEFRAYRETSVFFANNQTGQFSFDGGWVRGPLDNAPAAPGSIGQSFAQFLLGLPAGSSFVSRAASYAEQSTSWGFFFHDDWKVNSKLTINAGLRWEFEGPLQERFNRSVRGFNSDSPLPFAATAQARYAANPTPEVAAAQFKVAGGLTFAGVNGEPSGVYNTPKDLLMPRIGFAYKLGNKTVLRGGYGMFYGFLGQRRGDVIQTGFSRNTTMIPSLDNGLSYIATLSNPFPDGILEPLGASQGALTFVGQGVTYFVENPKAPRMQRWQVGFQREFAGGFVLEAMYVGNGGSQVEIGYNLNATPPQYLSTSPTRDQARIDYLSANLVNPFAGLLPAGASASLNGVNITRERLLRRYPQFDSVNASRFDGTSWYHSGQLNLEKRFSKGYTVNGAYTWSKFMQQNELLNALDASPTRLISDLDRPHRLTFSGIWELPVGKGRMLLTNVNKVGNAIIGGWQLTGIYQYQSGSPISFGNLIFRGDVKNLPLPGDQRTVARWFNADAGFEKAAPLQLASNIRNFPLRFSGVRTANINNYDLGLFKNYRIRENKTIQFKGEFLNAFNRVLLPAPNTNPTVPAFGQIQASTQANYPRRIQLTLKFLF